MRSLLRRFLPLLIPCGAFAAPVTVHVSAPTYAGERILLYRYLDLFTQRTEVISNGRLDGEGHATLDADVDGTVKALVRIGTVTSDLFLRGGTYRVEMPAPDASRPRSINGTTRVDLVFQGLDPLDINALTSDLNERLDAFVAEDLATDQAAGMQAVDVVRKNGGRLQADTVKRPATLFVTPGWSAARVDTFERKLRRFYAEVKDPWFWNDLDYGVAGLRFGPRANDRELYDRYLKGKAVLYDVPEYVRFFSSFFTGHLLEQPFRKAPDRLQAFIAQGEGDSVQALLARNDFLKDDARLRELVMLHGLYTEQGSQLFDRDGILRILERTSTASPFTEHRTIAADMLWDLTAMHPGAALPSLALRSPEGPVVQLDDLLQGPVCLFITAGWCTYCEQEMVAVDKLRKDYGAQVRFIGIGLDRSMEDLNAYVKAHPGRADTWLFGGDDPVLLDALRLKSIPTFFLLNGTTLVQAPAPLPSEGLGAVLHRIRAADEDEHRIRPDRGVPPPKH